MNEKYFKRGSIRDLSDGIMVIYIVHLYDRAGFLMVVIIYQLSKFMFSCTLLDESVSQESHEIRLFPANSSERWTLWVMRGKMRQWG
jgi:hypothetical protein